jgi:hypothetical protein
MIICMRSMNKVIQLKHVTKNQRTDLSLPIGFEGELLCIFRSQKANEKDEISLS